MTKTICIDIETDNLDFNNPKLAGFARRIEGSIEYRGQSRV